MNNTLTLAIEKNGVANLIFDLPNEKVNKLSESVLLELEKAINVIDGNKAIRVLLISSAKKDNFIAGADINEIRAIADEKSAYEKVSRGQNILDKIAKIKIPTIALINGSCLGGGLELALACKYRVAVVNQKTILGLPEVNLGIIPGFGGTQRLPQLVGLKEALQIILSGQAIDCKKAYKIGLVDDVVREEFLEAKLTDFVGEILQNQQQNIYLQKRKDAARKRFVFESLFLGRFFIFHFAHKNLFEKTQGNYPAPFYALEVVKRTYGRTYGAKGLKIELETFCDLITDSISKNLIEIFFTNESLKKDSGVNSEVTIHEVRNASLLGAGVMGGGIAWLFANKNINIRVKDISQKAIALGYNQIVRIFNQLQKKRKITPQEAEIKISKVTTTLDYAGFADSDFVIEAVVENMAIKKNILSEVEGKVASNTIIASNTSSLSISEMAFALKNPQRFAGMHFFNPVNRMPLVEVIRGEKTSDETIAAIVALSKKLGKTPIVVKDVAGFLVNRILLPYMNEAAYLLQEYGDLAKIDKIIEDFGMPMGPFTLADTVGIDVGVKVAHSLYEAYGERMKVAEILDEIYRNHKEILGKKSEKGFYVTESSGLVNKEIYQILNKVRKENNIHQIHLNDATIVDRCILTMVNEAAKCLEENVVKNARYLDMAMIMGAGFPAFRGGVLRYADSLGISEVVGRLQALKMKNGKRFEVSELLVQMAKEGRKFYD